jgi:hypothetical protein
VECALIRGIDESVVLEHALAAARDGHPVPLDGFLTLDQIDTLSTRLGPTSTDPGVSLPAELPDEISPELARLYSAVRDHASRASAT